MVLYPIPGTDEDVSDMDKTSQAGAAELNRAAPAATGWSPAVWRAACAAAALVCLLSVSAAVPEC
jgi:hypothetical protein